MLGSSPAVAFACVADLDLARAFYEGVLGLTVLSQDAASLLCEAGGVKLRITRLPSVAAAPHTVVGFEVEDIAAMVTALGERGVVFERYAFLGPSQGAQGIWTAPSGNLVAWFKDVDDNLLSIQTTA